MGKKEAHCEADEKEQGLGDCWGRDIIDVASRAVIVRVHGPRTAETVQSAGKQSAAVRIKRPRVRWNVTDLNALLALSRVLLKHSRQTYWHSCARPAA